MTGKISNFDVINDQKENVKEQNLRTADIAGSDLYSEQINVYVAGNKSVIRQSLFTNDTNIIPQFDTNDPAFYQCNFLISASNGIQPEIFPTVLTEAELKFPSIQNLNGFTGFLYYDEGLEKEEIEWRAARALDIIKNKFKIDLIMLKTNNNNFFPFVGYYPKWSDYLEKITENIPMDGYWKALDLDRLKNETYHKNYHLSSYFLMINSLEFLDETTDLSRDQLNFDLNDFGISLIQDVNATQFFDILTGGNESVSSDQQLSLAKDAHYTLIEIQYEGLAAGIEKVKANQYEFNLWDVMGYEGEALSPSEKIYIALMGAFMSQINVNVLCTEIINMNPKLFEFSEYLVDKINELTSLISSEESDTDFIEDYNLKLYWNSEGGICSTFMLPVNVEDPADIVNAIQLTGTKPFTSIPTGITNPIDEFEVTYKTAGSEPNMVLDKIIPDMNASYGINQEFEFNITLKNVGSENAWGIPTPYLLDLIDLEELLGETLYDNLWESVQKYFDDYDSLEEFLNLDEAPRLFYIDTWGTGVIDSYYPALTATNIYPYSEDMDELIDYIQEDDPTLYFTLLPFQNTFNNNDSIWNDDNWVIRPGENVSINPTNVSLANSDYDTYDFFYDCDLLIQQNPYPTPELVFGESIDMTNSTMALSTDGIGWNISAEEYYGNYELETIFIFQNQTKIDFNSNTFDGIEIIINFTDEVNLTGVDLSFEVFNFTEEVFESIPADVTTLEENKTLTVSFLKHRDHLKWVNNKDTPINNTIILKITRTDDQDFEISIDDINARYLKSEINSYNVSRTRVMYSGVHGYTYFTRSSNSLKLSNYDMASIIATSTLKDFTSGVKELNEYSLTLKNIGSSTAENISVSMMVPGIIEDSKNFTIRNNYLICNLSSLAPSQERTINFTFYTPNSGSINEAKITFFNQKLIENENKTSMIIYSNEVFFNAPVDYINRYPYLRMVEIFYNTTNSTPELDERFVLKINVKNVGSKGTSIPEVKMLVGDKYEGLHITSSDLVTIENINYNKIKSAKITLAKDSWKGYYYPPINFLDGNESRTVQILKSEPIKLGKINFSINKTVDQSQVAINDIITITINLKNTGTISIANFLLSDTLSFGEETFVLTEGRLVNNYSSTLNPGEKTTFSYKIRAKSQVDVNLTGAKITYYYLFKEEIYSNEINVKIVNPRIFQLFYIIIPSVISLATLIYYYRRTSIYMEEKFEMKRAEESLFQMSSRDSILKIEHTLRERLNILNENENRSLGGETSDE